MKRKILWLGLSFLLMAALVLTACPALAVEKEVTPPQSRFEGTEIYFFPGGFVGCVFATLVYNGARAAADDLGVDLKVYWSDWLSEKMITQFSEAVAAGPDGIAIIGYPGVEAFRPLIDDAIAMGIIVTSQNVDLPPIETDYKAKGFGYVGQELYPAGHLLATECIKRFNLGPGDKAMVWGCLQFPTRGLRGKGAMDAFEAAGLTVDYIQISEPALKDPSAQVPAITAYILANPDVKVIIADAGAAVTISNALVAAGVGPDEVVVGAFDINAPTIDGLRSGYFDLVLDQQPYLQGYLPILQICLTKYAGFSGLHIDTAGGIVDKDSVDLVAPLAEKGIR